jgi:hypothetical protein
VPMGERSRTCGLPSEIGDIHFRLAAFYRKLGDRQQANEAMQAFQELRVDDLAVSHNEIQALEDEKAPDPTARRPAPN